MIWKKSDMRLAGNFEGHGAGVYTQFTEDTQHLHYPTPIPILLPIRKVQSPSFQSKKRVWPCLWLSRVKFTSFQVDFIFFLKSSPLKNSNTYFLERKLDPTTTATVNGKIAVTRQERKL
jgi:hypothetical protein